MKVKKLVIANWKMNPVSLSAAEKLFQKVAGSFSGLKKTKIVACVPFPFILPLKKISKKITLGAQDTSRVKGVGAYTGEVSADMLYDAGVRYVLVGHSERRAMGESDVEINSKLKFALASGLKPILCVGERERNEDHKYFDIVKDQLEKCLNKISKLSISNVIIAYEPVWAISSTKNQHDATPADSLEMVIFIRKVLSDKFGKEAFNVRVIYGGSVNERNSRDFLKDGGVDGVLLGRASLNAEKFSEIIRISEKI